MEKLKLNETPIRTSKSFLINNIELENIEIPQNINEFETIEITKTNSKISEEVSKPNLVYGLGNIMESNVIKNANHKVKITIEPNKEVENIEIKYNFDDENTNLINYIEVEANSDANIAIKYESETEKKCFHNGILKLKAGKAINVNVTIVNLLNNISNNFEAIENDLEDESNVQYTIIDLGAQNSISNYYSNITGNGAKNDLKTIYLGTENQIKDINYIAEMRGKKSNIDIDVQGALNENAKKHFKGTIDFKKGCKKATGNENEYCMLLSDNAKSIALPMLLCTEEDVEGNHSTASGKVQESELFYIMSRGIDYKSAVKLMVRANFNKILARISDENLKNQILNEIDKRLD